jgi:hypothetical protein
MTLALVWNGCDHYLDGKKYANHAAQTLHTCW